MLGLGVVFFGFLMLGFIELLGSMVLLFFFFIKCDRFLFINSSNILSPPTQELSVQFSSVAQSCPTLCGPMNRSTPGLPVHYRLPEFAQTHVHRVGDTIQPSHPLSFPSPPAPNPSQYQSLFQ